jgi:elongation factor G
MVLLWLGLVPHSQADMENLRRGLARVTADDPSLAVKSASNSAVTIGAASEEQLDAVVDVLVHGFGVEAAINRIEVAYKEGLTAAAEGEAKYVTQSGGRGQYAHVKLRVEPGETGSGYVFEDAVAGAVPQRMIPSVDEGIREGLDRGVLAGYPIDDVRVTVYDGSYHEVDSSEAAFKLAGVLAFRDAARNARPILLEPIMRVSVTVPLEYARRVTDELRKRQSAFQSFHEEVVGTETVTTSMLVPLSQMFAYGLDLRARTDGLGTFSMTFSHYAPAILSGDDGDREADVTAPLRPHTPLRTLRASVPEPQDDSA